MELVFAGIDAFEKFTRFLEKQTAIAELPFVAGAEASSHVIYRNVRKVFGDNTKLADLAQATQDERTALGFTPNDPLKRDGTLLLASVKRFHEGLEAGAGSNEPIMLYSETGFVNARTGRPVPPRPAFEVGMRDSLAEIELILDAAIDVALGANISNVTQHINP
jgi:hypothetical protein